jgi:hypothetical protein
MADDERQAKPQRNSWPQETDEKGRSTNPNRHVLPPPGMVATAIGTTRISMFPGWLFPPSVLQGQGGRSAAAAPQEGIRAMESGRVGQGAAVVVE